MTSLEHIIAEVGRGEVTFPTHADVAFRVRLALDDPDLHLGKAAQIVQAEPLLAARVVALANSVAFNRGGQHVTDVRSAVTRLGVRFVRALATAVVMRQMASGLRSSAYRALSERLWEHTTHVAALANLLARRFLRPMADMAMFAGIVHEVGGFYLISRTDRYPDLFQEGNVLSAEAEMAVGQAVLKALAVPDEVMDAVSGLWQPGSPKFPPTSLADILRLANDLTPILSPLQQPDVQVLPADPNAVEMLAEILEQSGDEMGSLTSALRY
jgi:HD-like signal output (HDOD) protein